MASIGHVLVGLAVARAHDGTGEPRPMRKRVVATVAFATLALLPDLDVVAFRFGVPYEHALGHRGASHALATALLVGLLVAWPMARDFGARYGVTALAAVVALASHGLLDMLTDGGLGAAVLWPWSSERFFFPFQPIPVAPIGRAFLSARGLYCVLVELGVFSPLLAYALLARRSRPAGTKGGAAPTTRWKQCARR